MIFNLTVSVSCVCCVVLCVRCAPSAGTTAAPLRKYTLSRVLKEVVTPLLSVCGTFANHGPLPSPPLPSPQAARKRLPSGKVPHLRVRLKTINRGGRNARAVMQDPTGGWGRWEGWVR